MASDSSTKDNSPAALHVEFKKSGESIGGFTATSTRGEEEEEEEEQYPSKARLIVLTIAIMLVCSMSGLDTNIIGTAIPVLSSQFNSPTDIGWYGATYLLGITSFQGIYGNLYRLFNLKWVFLAAIALFEIGSIVCATAPNSPVFILGRSILGCGAAGTLSGALAIGPHLVPLRQRPFYFSLLASVFGLSGAVAPIIGGVFTSSHTLTWRFCFWINLPFGFLAALVIVFGYTSPNSGSRSPLSLTAKLKQLDLGGAVFLVSSMISLFLALQWGGLKFPWSDSRVWGCVIGFALLFLAFLVVQYLRKDGATIPFRVIKQRSIAAAALCSICLNFGHYCILYYVPFYFQGVRGATPRASGVDLLPYILVVFVSAIAAGFVATRTGIFVPFIWASTAIFAVACGLLHTLGVNAPTSRWIGFEILAGIGYGIGFQMPLTLVQVCLRAHDKPAGNALFVFCQTFGGSLGISIAQNIFNTSLRVKLGEHLSSLIGPSGGGDVASLLSQVSKAVQPIVRDSYAYAFKQTFLVIVIVTSIAFPFSLALGWKRIGKETA